MSNLFDFADAPAARATDPATSHAAIEEHTRSGARASQAARILAAITANPGKTAGEIGKLVGLTNVQVCRRIADLVKLRSVTECGSRICTAMKSSQTTWRATGT